MRKCTQLRLWRANALTTSFFDGPSFVAEICVPSTWRTTCHWCQCRGKVSIIMKHYQIILSRSILSQSWGRSAIKIGWFVFQMALSDHSAESPYALTKTPTILVVQCKIWTKSLKTHIHHSAGALDQCWLRNRFVFSVRCWRSAGVVLQILWPTGSLLPLRDLQILLSSTENVLLDHDFDSN